MVDLVVPTSRMIWRVLELRMIADQPEDRVRPILAARHRRIARALLLRWSWLRQAAPWASEAAACGPGSATAFSISSRVNCPVWIGSRPLMPWAASPSAMAFTSSGCSLQNSATWSNDSAVFSTSQTAVAFGIRGASCMG